MSILSKKLLTLFNKSDKRGKKNVLPVISFETAKSVGVLYTWKDNQKELEVEKFIDLLKNEGKSVDTLCYNPGKETINTINPVVSVTDLSALGKLNADSSNAFSNKPFDFLFHLDFELDEIVQSILNQTNARCRVGYHSPDNSSYYELMIGIDKSAGLSNFTAQIVKYIKAIK
ncbi:DUF6913 domain-containing protein [Roseivirga sp.]|uniref:DUF6913 domain-containing protein n=1 Tax=Roseivirga sp. TaxID=1964215 RepID=UPI003B8C7916